MECCLGIREVAPPEVWCSDCVRVYILALSSESEIAALRNLYSALLQAARATHTEVLRAVVYHTPQYLSHLCAR